MAHDNSRQSNPRCMDLEAEANSEEHGTFLGFRGKARVVLLVACLGTLAFATFWLLTHPAGLPSAN